LSFEVANDYFDDDKQAKKRRGEGLTCYLQLAQWGQIISEAAF